MHVKFGWLVLLFISLLSCNEDVLYRKQYEISKGEWKYDNKLAFEFEIRDTTGFNSIDLEVEYDENVFGFQNLYINIKTTFPDQKMTNQVVSLEILGEEAQMLRNCTGSKCSVTILLLDNFKFKLPGTHTIEISQYSRNENLKGISGLGLSIVKKE